MKHIYTLIILLILGFFVQEANAQTFTKTTMGNLTTGTGVAAGDFDNDGDDDIFIANYNNELNELYQNNGNGTFTHLSGAAPSLDGGSSTSANWVDYNNDGFLDLYVLNDGQNNFLYSGNGDGTFVRQTGNALEVLTYTWNAAWVDYNLDGFIDVYVPDRISGSYGYLFSNNGDGTFTEIFNAFDGDSLSTVMALWIDYDSDMDPDLFLVNQSSERNQLYQNNGNGTFTEILTGSIVTDISSSWSASVGYFNNDHRPDIFITNEFANNELYINNGSGFTKTTSGDILLPGGNSPGSSVVGDIDNDGDEDIVVTSYGDTTRVYVNNGSANFTYLNIGVSEDSYGTALIDVNNDGLLDIFKTVFTTTLANNIYLNTTATSNIYTRVKLKGLQRNGDAIGAKIRIQTDIQYDTKHVQSISGWGSQNPHTLHFGLGASTIFYNAYIQWPDGNANWYNDLKLNETNTIYGMGPALRPSYGNKDSKVQRGDNFDAYISINNNENYDAGVFKIEYYISTDSLIDGSDYYLDSLFSDGVAANSWYGASKYPTIPADFAIGQYYILVHIDALDQVEQVNEHQNFIVWPVEIIDYALPDLTLYTYLNRSTYNAGTEFDINYSRLYNYEDTLATNVEVKYYISSDNIISADDSLIYSTLTNINEYSNVDLNPTLVIPATMPIGTYRLISVADPGGLIEELNETNNLSVTYFNVTDKPAPPTNLSATAISVSQIDLTWSDNATVETEYRIYRDAVLIATLAADVEFYSDLTAVAGVEYTYYVEAYNASGINSSNQVIITIDASTDAQILVKQATGSPVTDLGNSVASAWGDFNNDGFEDLFVANVGEANFLYQNNGDGTFTKVTGVAPVNGVESSVNASWADFDNDGWLDLFVVNYADPNNLYKNNGDGTFTDVAVAAGVDLSGTQGCTWGDYDMDGLVDLFVTSNGNVNNNLYKNNGDGTFSSVAIPGMTDSGGETINAVWAHLNYDNYIDLFVVNEYQKNQLFFNNGDGTFTQQTSGSIVNDIEPSWGVSIGDYNNDGYQDLYVVNKSYPNSLYRNYGWGFEKVNVGVSGGSADSESSTWIDFDNDGDMDLFVANVNANNMLFRNNGDGTFTSLLVGDVVNDGGQVSTSTSWADVNNDGFPDLFVTNASGQNNLLYINAKNSNNFISFKLEGFEANNSAIGARLSLQSSDGVSTYYENKQVISNTGARGQNSFTLHFGLGAKTTVSDVQISWPDGNYTYPGSFAINQKHIIQGMGIDLVPYFSSNVKTVIKQGNDLQIDAWVNNNSNYVTDTFKVAYYLSADTIISSGDILLDTVRVNGLSAYGNTYVGITKNISQSFPLGTYKLIMKADVDGVQRESNEVNNLIHRNLTITDKDLPDVEAWNWVERWNYNAGTTVKLYGGLYNNSIVDIPKVSFELYFSDDDTISVDDVLIMSVDSVNLPSYTDYQIDTSYSLPAGLAQGEYRFILMADQDSVLQEGSETNNRSISYIFISDFPAHPSNLVTSVVSTSQINLNWTDNSNNETSYTVERDGVVIATLGADVTSYSDNSVTIDVTYKYRVRASNAFGNSYYSNEATGLIANIPELLIPVTTGSIVTNGGSSTGASWGDFNNDGFEDLYVTNAGENNFLYQNNGDGTFTSMVTLLPATSGGNSVSSAWADYNNDGWIDLYVVNNGGNNQLFKNNGDGSFTNTASTANVLEGNMGAAWGDYNNDGWLDLYVTNTNGVNNILYKNNGNGTFTTTIITGPTTGGGNSIMANWIDFDNNGWLDLFIVNYNQANQLFINNGDETFTKVTEGAIVQDIEASWSASWGDYNNDGYLDVFVANKEQNNSLYKNLYGGSFEKITNDDIVQGGGNSEGSAWGDYDNDGDLDLFVANVFENNMLYQNDGDGLFTKVVLGDVVNEGSMISTGSAFADVNNDGFLDLFVANAAGQNNLFYLNSTNSNNWVRVKLEGVSENPSAIGAQVRLSTDYIWQYRHVQSSTGARAQGSLELSFGIGSQTTINGLNVGWPDGSYMNYTVPVNQRTVIFGMGPDIRARYSIYMDQKIKQGDTLELYGIIENNTSYPVDSVSIVYYLSADSAYDISDIAIDTVSLTSINAWDGRYALGSYIIPASQPIGKYYVVMNVDPQNKLRELSKNNNIVISPLQVIDYDLPDLSVTVQSGRTNYNAGTDFEYTLTASNSGAVGVNGAAVGLYLSTDNQISGDDLYLGERIFDLPANSSIVIDTTYSLSASLAPGWYAFIVIIDEASLHEETSETNNRFWRWIQIVESPAPPSQLAASVISSSQVDLSWVDNSNNETEFVIQRDGVQIATVGTNVTTYSDASVTTETFYEYTVYATNSNGNSSATYTDIFVLAAPTGLTTSVAGLNQIDLTWTDNSSNELDYVIERNGQEVATIPGNSTSFSDTGLASDSSYIYRVKAVQSNGASEYSASSTTDLLTAPSNVTIALASSNQLDIAWSDNSSKEAEYVIERNGTALDTVAANTGFYADVNVTAENTYSYRVKAANAAGESGFSTSVSFTMLAAPSGVSGSLTGLDRLSLTWIDNSNLETTQVIERDGVEIGSVTSGITSYNDATIATGNTYTYRIKVKDNSGGESVYSNEFTIEYLPIPTNVVGIVVNENQIDVSWTDHSATETAFSISRDGVEIGTVGADITSYSDQTVAPENIYAYVVKATNANGESWYSDTAKISVLAAPTDVATTVSAANQIDVSWMDNSNLESGFSVIRNGVEIGTTGADITSFADNTVAEEVEYIYQLRATASNGASAVSVGDTILILTAPTGLSAALASDGSIALNWTDNSGTETSYEVLRNGVVIATIGANSNTYSDSPPSAEQTYTYGVRAVGKNAVSFTAEVNYTMLGQPSNVALEPTSDNEIFITWQDNSTLESNYLLFRNGIQIATLDPNIVNYQDFDVGPENTYTYNIKAIGNNGESLSSNDATLKLLFRPTELQSNFFSQSELQVSWTDNSSAESGYEIYRDGTLVGSEAANATTFVDNGLSTEIQYAYVLRAMDATDGRSAWSDTLFVTIPSDTEGPALTIKQKVTAYQVGSSAKFIIQATDATGVSEVRFYYKALTATPGASFTQVTATNGAAANEYDVVLADNMFSDQAGILGVFEGWDAVGNQSVTDTVIVNLKFNAGEVTATGIKSGTTIEAYQIISIPLNLDNKSVEAVFADLGTYDKTKWRMFHYSNGALKEYKEGFTNIERGKGYWLIAKESGSSISLGAGNTDNGGETFAINLVSGWNQIGNPHLFDVSWNEILAYNGLTTGDLSEFFVYQNGSYSATSNVTKFKGGFVNSPGSMTLEIPYPATQSGRLASNPIEENFGNIENSEWVMALSLKAGQYNYNLGGIGIHPKADVSKDQYDRLNPPKFINYMEINFAHPEYSWSSFARDVVPTQENYTWEFTVESNLLSEQLQLNWDSQIAAGTSKKLILKDVTSNTFLDMADVSSYTFTNDEKREFQLIYGSEAYIENQLSSDRTEILHAYPNPFTDEITLPFALKGNNATFEVELSIISINGEKLVTLFNEKLTSGYHQYTWDGRLGNGTELSPGIYIQEMIVKDGYNQQVYRIKLIKK